MVVSANSLSIMELIPPDPIGGIYEHLAGAARSAGPSQDPITLTVPVIENQALG